LHIVEIADRKLDDSTPPEEGCLTQVDVMNTMLPPP